MSNDKNFEICNLELVWYLDFEIWAYKNKSKWVLA